jgi:hypothetical protein
VVRYQLTITIDPDGLAQIQNAHQYVLLLKRPPYSREPLAWLVLNPPLEMNVISWEEPDARTDARSGTGVPSTHHHLVQDATVLSPSAVPGTGWRGIEELQGLRSGYDLAEITSINDQQDSGSASTIAPMLHNDSASLAASQTIYVLLQDYVNGDVLVLAPPATICMVTLSTSAPTATLVYDDETHTFYVDPASTSHQVSP